MNYLVVYEESGKRLWFTTLSWVIEAVCGRVGPIAVYELKFTPRWRPRLVLVDRKELIEAVRDAGLGMEKLAHVRNPFKGKPGLPEGSQHITKDESGELVIRPYQEAP